MARLEGLLHCIVAMQMSGARGIHPGSDLQLEQLPAYGSLCRWNLAQVLPKAGI